MSRIVLFDTKDNYLNLLPLTFTRPIGDLRVGIVKLWEKWLFFDKKLKISFLSEKYLSKKYPFDYHNDNIYVNSSFIANAKLYEEIKKLKTGQGLTYKGEILAFKSDKYVKIIEGYISVISTAEYNEELLQIKYPWDIFYFNGKVLEKDFYYITNGKKSQTLSNTVNIINKENVFVEEGVNVHFATLNAQEGFIYLGKDVEVMEGTVVRGSLAMCEHSVLKLSAKIYGPTTIGPYSKVGGEVNNSVIWGYSNKAHDGFLGNAVLGQWCNIGADTNNSNLKNNYAEVKMWNYKQEHFISTGLQFCGLTMGDHSKCGINTMFNTGTVVGVNANIFGSGFPRNFIPSFSWGGPQGFTEYKLHKALEVAERVMLRRQKVLDNVETEILSSVFENTKKYRSF